jgi:sugar O-acyltransferase (sialic acid O-acetyltransferase NeuD family)
MYLFGAGGHAKVIIEIAERSEVRVEGLYDDNKDIVSLLGYPVVYSQYLHETTGMEFIISVGNNIIRKEISNRFRLRYVSFLADPSSSISKRAELGHGSVVTGQAIINSGSRIGNHVIVNTSASIDHDCIISDYAHISPNATILGGTQIGTGAHIGAGAIVLPNLSVGSWTIVGAGAVVLQDVPDNAVIVGNPARIIKFNTPPAG